MQKSMIQTHPAEIARALRTHKFEQADHGILLPAAKTFISGALRVRDYQDGSEQFMQIAGNTLLVQGLAHILNSVLVPTGGYTPITAWYVAPWSNDYTPDGSETAATLPGLTGEFEAYTLGTRLPLVVAAATATASQQTNEVIMTFNASGGPFDVYGGSIVSASAKSNTGGKALASARLGAPRLDMANGDKLGWAYAIEASDAS